MSSYVEACFNISIGLKLIDRFNIVTILRGNICKGVYFNQKISVLRALMGVICIMEYRGTKYSIYGRGIVYHM